MEAVSVPSSLDVIVLLRVRMVSRNEDARALKSKNKIEILYVGSNYSLHRRQIIEALSFTLL